MRTEDREKLRLMIGQATGELTKGAQQYRELLQALQSLDRSLDETPTAEALQSTLQAFPPPTRPTRAGASATDGLKETKQLWQELNRIVKSRQGENAK
jgi:hypothetical protein